MATIAYRGNFQPEQPDPWSTEHQIAATLEAMGHHVHRIQEVGDQKVGWRETTDACLNVQADMFLWTTTTETDPAAARASLDLLRNYSIPSVGYHLDLWWELGRQPQLLEHPFFRATDFVFTADGGHQRRFRDAGIAHHYWAEPAAYKPNCQVGTKRPGPWPVAFVGSFPYPHPEHARARLEIVTWMQQRFPGRFRAYTGREAGRPGGFRNQALTDLVAETVVMVGDSCLAGRIPYYWSERVPEMLGRGAFLVHPYVPGMEHSYSDGEHLRWFEPGDLAQLEAIVQWGLDHPEEAAKIGDAGHQHVLDRHTYEHRLTDVLDIVLGGADD